MLTYLAAAVLFISVLILFLVEPRKSVKSQYSKFAARNYAHRGLHTPDGAVPENSMAAFERAAEAGYGIELDVRMTKDKKIVVFHDDDTTRVCLAGGRICDMTYEELSSLRLRGTDQGIPLFSDVLNEVNGRVPLIVEIKTSGFSISETCSLVWELLSGYDGLYCVESFDPRAVGWFKKHHANVYRGQLVSSYRSLRKDAPGIVAFLISNVLTNVIARPHFIAHSTENMTAFCKLCLWLGARRFTWVCREKENSKRYEAQSDGVIFEFYDPKPKYYKEL